MTPDRDALTEVLRRRLCGFDFDGDRTVRVELLGSLEDIADALIRTSTPDCGGCQGLGAHRRWCPEVVGHAASIWGPMAEQAETLGDRIGSNEMRAANHLYAAAGLIRKLAVDSAKKHQDDA